MGIDEPGQQRGPVEVDGLGRPVGASEAVGFRSHGNDRAAPDQDGFRPGGLGHGEDGAAGEQELLRRVIRR